MLPKISTPTYLFTVPSTKQEVKFRPFLSKEEKVLFHFKESDSVGEMLRGMKEVIEACSFNVLDASKLALFDIEYLFLKLRGKSVGEKIEFEMKCPEENCKGTIPITVDIDKIEIQFPENHTNKIMIEDEIGITLKYPDIENIVEFTENSDEIDDIEVIRNSIETVFTSTEVFDIKDIPKEELDDFVDSIPLKKINEIREKFFYTIPSLEYTVKSKCIKCGKEQTYTFSGIADFF